MSVVGSTSMASRTATPPPLATPPSTTESTATPKTTAPGSSMRDAFIVLAIAVSVFIMAGHSEVIVALAEQSWKKGVAMFCAKFLALSLGFACWFSALVYMCLKATSYKDGSHRVLKTLGTIFLSLLMISGSYAVVHYVKEDSSFDFKAFAILWAKSTFVASLWLLGLYGVSQSSVHTILSGHIKLDACAGTLLLLCYSAFIISYMRKDWEADMAFFKVWLQFTVLIELPLLAHAAVLKFSEYVHKIAAPYVSRDAKENIPVAVVAVVLSLGITYLASLLSVAAYEPDGCSYYCWAKFELAATLFAKSVILIAFVIGHVQKLGLKKIVKELISISLIFLNAAVILIAHGYKLPKWFQHITVLTWIYERLPTLTWLR